MLYEALRYAAFLSSSGVEDRWSVLDRIVLTKLLPKVHGTCARVEAQLREMLSVATAEEGRGWARECRSRLYKLERMLAVLIEAQFVSFTE